MLPSFTTVTSPMRACAVANTPKPFGALNCPRVMTPISPVAVSATIALASDTAISPVLSMATEPMELAVAKIPRPCRPVVVIAPLLVTWTSPVSELA